MTFHSDWIFKDAAPVWLESRIPYLSPRTAHDYKKSIRYLSPLFGEMKLATSPTR